MEWSNRSDEDESTILFWIGQDDWYDELNGNDGVDVYGGLLDNNELVSSAELYDR